MNYNFKIPFACVNTKEDLSGQMEKVEEELKEFRNEHYNTERAAKLRELGFPKGSFDERLQQREKLIDEGLDVITAVFTYFHKAGVSESELIDGVTRVDMKNLKRGYF